MPRNPKPGDRIDDYRIIDLISVGGMARSYAATSPGGEKVFFKQYKSPTTTVPWYKGYVSYQAELKRRVETSTAKNFTYRFVDFFEADFGGVCYFQVFEFVEGGRDLEAVFNRARENPRSVSWEQRLTLAKVMMAGINSLHEARIVHCDLKPPNIQLFEDKTIAAGYRLKLIDMDFSILSDRQAPWHGHQGYVGSPNYFSPEHLQGPAGVPQLPSDVFTCGLILYELLAGTHPYASEDPEAYAAASRAHRAPLPKLLGPMPTGASDADVADVLHRCLSPDPARRPTAKEVNLALNGKWKSSSAPPSPSGAAPAPSPAPAPSAAAPAGDRGVAGRVLSKLTLTAESGRKLEFSVRTLVGKHLLASLGPDARYFDAVQFVVEQGPAGQWMVVPNVKAKNETMVNGKALTETANLKPGDVVGVGRESKGIVKLPLSVQIG